MASPAVGTVAAVVIATLHPASEAVTPDGSIRGWIWLAVVLAIVVMSGLVLASRR